jgi:hypothetical protein
MGAAYRLRIQCFILRDESINQLTNHHALDRRQWRNACTTLLCSLRFAKPMDLEQ